MKFCFKLHLAEFKTTFMAAHDSFQIPVLHILVKPTKHLPFKW